MLLVCFDIFHLCLCVWQCAAAQGIAQITLKMQIFMSKFMTCRCRTSFELLLLLFWLANKMAHGKWANNGE